MKTARTIPTSVGKTPLRVEGVDRSADHPHVRGENSVSTPSTSPRFGPSPRPWGKRAIPSRLLSLRRTIPTSVGKTHGGGDGRCGRSDHPHVRGENGRPRLPRNSLSGPSPRPWGKPFLAGSSIGIDRTIPTSVGKTKILSSWSIGSSDHPHVRGENVSKAILSDLLRGPSPRPWGKLFRVNMTLVLLRTIPTSVGKTSPPGCRGRGGSDHPHVRGENLKPLLLGAFAYGPSPRPWGKRGVSTGAMSAARTIPTSVGKTLGRVQPSQRIPDHPHVRGENTRKIKQLRP